MNNNLRDVTIPLFYKCEYCGARNFKKLYRIRDEGIVLLCMECLHQSFYRFNNQLLPRKA